MASALSHPSAKVVDSGMSTCSGLSHPGVTHREFKMQQTLIPFGLHHGRLVRAIEVANGLACGCLCPGCNTPLIAANRGTKNVHHFRHAQSVDCRSTYEASLHKFAVDLLIESKRIVLPDFSQVISNRTRYGAEVKKRVAFPGAQAEATQASAGVMINGVTPDVVFDVGGHQLIIEVRASAKVDDLKRHKLKASELSVLEVDLSTLDMKTICEPELFERALLDDPGNKRWIHSRRGEQMLKAARCQLAEDVKAMDDAHRQKAQAIGLSSVDGGTRPTIAASVQGKPLRVSLPVDTSRSDKQAWREAIQERAGVIAASIQRSVNEWGGKAMQCENCLMASHPDAVSCSYCGVAKTLKAETFTRDYSNTALARLSCSPRVDQSYERAPVLHGVHGK